MDYVERSITSKLLSFAAHFPAVFLTGPRQSGKSTLLRQSFPHYRYVNLEEKDTRDFAVHDPRGFLNRYGSKLIIDEAQRAPDIFSYLQTRIDEADEPGMYILSGSQNFLMMENISQSLAGRTGVLTLLPFSFEELRGGRFEPLTTNEWLVGGGYPRMLTLSIRPEDFFPSYLDTYVERDVRHETSVRDIARFRVFLRACAAKVGSNINLSDLGRDIGADARTVAAWLAVLEESYLVFRLTPYYRAVGNRHTKTAKLYFYDTGLLCSLLNLRSADALNESSFRGALFENAVIAEFFKRSYNAGRRLEGFYWRNPSGKNREVDLVVEDENALKLYEIKSSQTANRSHVDNLVAFSRHFAQEHARTVIYDGPDGVRLAGVEFVNWRTL